MITAKLLLLENKSWVQEKLALDPDYFQRFAATQSPEFLWIGCSDSRIPTNEITVTTAGELFVHRNIANLIVENDVNALSVVQYAVDTLKVRDVIVCGHYGCGGVRAALLGGAEGPLGVWLRHIQAIYFEHRQELDALPDETARWDRLVELNTIAQVRHLERTEVIQRAWARGEGPALHGWVYRLDKGVLTELVAIDPPHGRPGRARAGAPASDQAPR
jgi:carbonic anhydrase